MAVDFGVFVPQGWRMDLVGIEDPYEQYEAMTRVAKVADETRGLRLHLGLRPLPHRPRADEGDHLRGLDDQRRARARHASNVKIGQMVTCNGYRNPALLAKIASTVDVMSNGRLLFGLGAGWYEHEWLAYGYGFPEVPVRMRMFKEACEIVHRMFTEDDRRLRRRVLPAGQAHKRAQRRKRAAPADLDRGRRREGHPEARRPLRRRLQRRRRRRHPQAQVRGPQGPLRRPGPRLRGDHPLDLA